MNDIKCSGSQTIEGGEYGEIHVSGSFISKGNMKCNNIAISGSCHLDSDMDCQASAEIAGSLNCAGNFKSDVLKCSGSVSVGSLKVNNGHIAGSVHCTADMNVSVMKICGSVQAVNINADELTISGNLICDGQVNAGILNIKSYYTHSAKAESIVGGKITIKSDWTKKLFCPLGQLTTSFIEGDDIDIDYVVCDSVRGKNVKIGKHCSIKRVEYTNTCECNKEAKIGECIKSI